MALLKIRPKSINVDLPPEQVGDEEWTSGTNVTFRDDCTLSARGSVPVWGTPLARPRWMVSVPGATPKLMYAGATTMLCATDGTTHADITPVGGFGNGSPQGNYTGGLFNGLAIANDGVHAPCSWNGALASLAVSAPGYPVGDKAKALRPFKYYLVQIGGTINGTDSPYSVRWSVSAAPGAMPASWTPAATNDAGDATLAGAAEPLVDAAPLRDSLLVFEPHATWQLSYVGGVFVMNNRKVLNTAGLLSPSAWASLGSECIFVSDGDVLRTDGQTVQSLISRRMRSAMFSVLNSSARDRVFMAVNAFAKQVYVFFPTGTSEICTRALVWDWEADKIGMVDFMQQPGTAIPGYAFACAAFPAAADPLTWDSDANAWNVDLQAWNFGAFASGQGILVGSRAGFDPVGQFDSISQLVVSPDGPLAVIAAKDKMALGDPSIVKQVTRIYPRMQGPSGTEVFWRVGVAADPGAPTSWGPEVSFKIGQSHKIDCRMSGRYVGVQVRSATNNAWQCSGFDIEFQAAGKR